MRWNYDLDDLFAPPSSQISASSTFGGSGTSVPNGPLQLRRESHLKLPAQHTLGGSGTSNPKPDPIHHHRKSVLPPHLLSMRKPPQLHRAKSRPPFLDQSHSQFLGPTVSQGGPPPSEQVRATVSVKHSGYPQGAKLHRQPGDRALRHKTCTSERCVDSSFSWRAQNG